MRKPTMDEIMEDCDDFDFDEFLANYELVDENQPDMEDIDILLSEKEFCNNGNRN